jgi:hypothetical protein
MRPAPITTVKPIGMTQSHKTAVIRRSMVSRTSQSEGVLDQPLLWAARYTLALSPVSRSDWRSVQRSDC